MRARRRRARAASALAVCALACAGRPELEEARVERAPPAPDRREYLAFRAAHPDVIEPNYLPFMLHRVPDAGPAGDLLLLCRWDEARMPLRVAIETPRIPEALQDEFHPTAPERYADAAARALVVWERALGGLVRFERAEPGARADIEVRLTPARAPTPRPDVVVLGATEALRGACATDGWDPDAERQRVRFEVSALEIFLADEHGLLTAEQVHRIALHELGHALGMLGHSPDEGDLMFAAYRDRSAVATPSAADIASFRSLYALPNGALYGYARAGAPPARLPPLPPPGAPTLRDEPELDSARGLSLRLPHGWLVAPTARGLFAANGPSWDYDASIELAVFPYARVEELLARRGAALLEGAWLRRRERTSLAGRDGIRFVVEPEEVPLVRDVRIVELGDGRILMAVVQCKVEAERAWSPWLEAALTTLAIERPD